MTNEEPTYDSVMTQLRAYMTANGSLAEENAFGILANGAKYLDYTSYLLRCLQAFIREAKLEQLDVTVFFGRVLRLLECQMPLKMNPEFMGEKPPAKSEQAKRTRIPALRHSLTDAWEKLLEKGLPDHLLIDALVALGDGQIEKMTDTARLLAPYITTVFDPPQTAEECGSLEALPLASWSRGVARTLLKVMHLGGLNFDRLYPRLYALLGEDLFTCPHVERFLVDLDTFLMSIHVPASWLSAFAKRLTQLSVMGAAPLALLTPLLTVAANCLIRHPSCRFLIGQRSTPLPDTSTAAECAGGEPYVYHADDLPGDAETVEASSLWEVASLECHFHPEVAALAHRIRQIASTFGGVEHLPEMRNQLEAGKQMQSSVERKARQYMAVLEMTNARMPSLAPLEGWTCSTTTETSKVTV